ncbi:MAG: enoyl-CoA hydratase/isomerase family protein [Dehalococcoidia bacterium]
MAYDAVTCEKKGPVAVVTLNRPEASNAVDAGVATELKRLVQEIKDDEEVRVVVLTGSGNSFCIGSELDIAAVAGEGAPSQTVKHILDQHRVADAVAGLKCPVIGVINGDAVGQGLELALACDIRLVAQSARLGLDHVKSGLIPWDGATQRLPRQVGRGMALSMILSGEPVDGNEALRIGLVHQVFPADSLLQEATQLAEKIAAFAPIALRYIKEAVNQGMELTLDQGLRLEQDLTLILQTTEDRVEGISAFLEKRSPQFKGE